jgi:hypothetical protein
VVPNPCPARVLGDATCAWGSGAPLGHRSPSDSGCADGRAAAHRARGRRDRRTDSRHAGEAQRQPCPRPARGTTAFPRFSFATTSLAELPPSSSPSAWPPLREQTKPPEVTPDVGGFPLPRLPVRLQQVSCLWPRTRPRWPDDASRGRSRTRDSVPQVSRPSDSRGEMRRTPRSENGSSRHPEARGSGDARSLVVTELKVERSRARGQSGEANCRSGGRHGLGRAP